MYSKLPAVGATHFHHLPGRSVARIERAFRGHGVRKRIGPLPFGIRNQRRHELA